jgi:hypothetical protein
MSDGKTNEPASASTPPATDGPLPGEGFFGWLGRQIGHIRHAIHADVTQPPSPAAPDSKTVWRDSRIEEQPSPDDPRVKLRRTVIDEVIVTNDPSTMNEPPPK